eukprot:1161267-Pelagomonas_calceolata.AAC.6
MMVIRRPQITLLASDHPIKAHSSTLGPLFSSGSFDRRAPVTRGGRPTDHINKIWPAWPSEHNSKEREQKTR